LPEIFFSKKKARPAEKSGIRFFGILKIGEILEKFNFKKKFANLKKNLRKSRKIFRKINFKITKNRGVTRKKLNKNFVQKN